ncbi:MAG TPA: hypothetical protein VF508_04240 [Pyrinomonadaceae bacterium]|jgi:hypothetical protein
MSDQTTYHKWHLPLSHERNLEAYLRLRLIDIDAALGNDYIAGLRLEFVSASSIKVNPGVAFVQGFGRMRVSAAITVASISLGAGAWGHVYLYSNSGVAAVEVVTTAPVNYFGSAWQKTGDTSRRYLGSVRTDASGNIYNFNHNPQTNFIRYRANQFLAPFRVLSNGVATSATDVDCSAVVPVTLGGVAYFRVDNQSSASAVYFGASDGFTPSSAGGEEGVGTLRDMRAFLTLNPSRVLKYIFGLASGASGVYMDVHGYFFQR